MEPDISSKTFARLLGERLAAKIADAEKQVQEESADGDINSANGHSQRIAGLQESVDALNSLLHELDIR